MPSALSHELGPRDFGFAAAAGGADGLFAVASESGTRAEAAAGGGAGFAGEGARGAAATGGDGGGGESEAATSAGGDPGLASRLAVTRLDAGARGGGAGFASSLRVRTVFA